jgi:hypothetical protein
MCEMTHQQRRSRPRRDATGCWSVLLDSLKTLLVEQRATRPSRSRQCTPSNTA